MKLATYQTAAGPALGIVLPEQGRIINAAAACTIARGTAAPGAASRTIYNAGADRKR